MMVFLYMLYLGSDLPEGLKIPAYLRSPLVTWADVNGDGITDIYVKERSRRAPEYHDRFWFYDGRWAETPTRTSFLEMAYDPIPGKVTPVGDEGQVRPRAYVDGLLLDYTQEQGWTSVKDFALFDDLRPEIEPIPMENALLVPTFSGYRLMRGQCLSASFNAHPSVQVNRRKLTLTWPVPQPFDLDGDGQMDLISAPVRSPQHGTANLWYALKRGDSWQEGSCKLQFPSSEAVVGFQFGDVDGDTIKELVILTRPDKDLSIFEEMGFIVYSGLDHGQWEPVPRQTLKTKQNLWQNGPIEMGPEGIIFYYYKGLFRAKFKMDRFAWDNAGYIKPKPISDKWKLEGADRSMISLKYDFNGDNRKDLVLADIRGMVIYYRKQDGDLPFDDTPDRILGVDQAGRGGFEISIGDDNEESLQTTGILGRLRGDSHTLVDAADGAPPSFWEMKQALDGFWYLRKKTFL